MSSAKQQSVAVEKARNQLTEQGIDVLRMGYSDLLGVDRGRDFMVKHLTRTLVEGGAFCRSVFGVTPRGDVIDIDGGLSDGLPDVEAIADFSTLRHLPWEPGVAHVIADIYNPDGTPSPESPRHVLGSICEQYEQLGLTPIVGPEIEFYLLEPNDKAPNGWSRYAESTGNVYTTGTKVDPKNVLLQSVRLLEEYGLDVSASNHEFSSGQYEINLWHGPAKDAADRAHRCKTAIKEIVTPHGLQATFMPKPFNDEGGSGYHLHLSLLDAAGTAVFHDPSAADDLSKTARHAIGGLLAHAPALAAIANPTINSYKRLGPDTLAPWLIDWGMDNRSAMVRVPPEHTPGTMRLELRLGDASANSYLVIAGALAAILLGIRGELEPPEPLSGYGYDPSRSAQLPGSLCEALDHLEADTQFAALLGEPFVKAFLIYKRDEAERFRKWTTDWEFAEYAGQL